MQTVEMYIDTISGERLRKEVIAGGNIKRRIVYQKVVDGKAINHRVDGPSDILFMDIGNSYFYEQDGKLHRTDGPAYIVLDEQGKTLQKEYFIKGQQITDALQISIIQTKEVQNGHKKA